MACMAYNSYFARNAAGAGEVAYLLPLPPGEGRGEGVVRRFPYRSSFPALYPSPPYPNPLPNGGGTRPRIS